mgnify:CR=1 FL=1|jgi:hypothetical protein
MMEMVDFDCSRLPFETTEMKLCSFSRYCQNPKNRSCVLRERFSFFQAGIKRCLNFIFASRLRMKNFYRGCPKKSTSRLGE